MTNTIPNVPRELLADLLGNDHDKRIMAERHLLAMLANAPSPAGVDGLAVSSAGWFSLVMNAAAELETASYSITDPDAKRVAQSGADYYRSKAKSSQVVCLSDAQAIIDGLAAENHQLRRELNLRQSQIKSSGRIAERAQRFAVQLRTERDQQAQRIGELEGLLRDFAYHTQRREMPTESSLAEWADRIDAALSAVCAAAPNIAPTSEHSSQPERTKVAELVELVRSKFPRIDPCQPVPLDEKAHCCEYTIYVERERLHRIIDAKLASLR